MLTSDRRFGRRSSIVLESSNDSVARVNSNLLQRADDSVVDTSPASGLAGSNRSELRGLPRGADSMGHRIGSGSSDEAIYSRRSSSSAVASAGTRGRRRSSGATERPG